MPRDAWKLPPNLVDMDDKKGTLERNRGNGSGSMSVSQPATGMLDARFMPRVVRMYGDMRARQRLSAPSLSGMQTGKTLRHSFGCSHGGY